MSGLGELLAGVGDPDDAVVLVADADGGEPAATTRADLERIVAAVAKGLRAARVEPGHAVCVGLDNGPDLVAALFAVWSVGAVYAPTNPRSTDTEIAHVLDLVRPAAIITTPAGTERFGEYEVLTVSSGSVMQNARASVQTASQNREAKRNNETEAKRNNDTEAKRYGEEVALISFTSGTTGRPKPVPLTHDGVLTILDNVIGSMKRKPATNSPATSNPATDKPDRRPMPNLIPVSMSLWAGIYQVLFAFRVGAPIVVLPRFDTAAFAHAIRRFEIRSTVLPPAAMTMLCDDEAITTLEPLRFVRSISSPLSPLQARRFRDRFGIAVLNGWGQTELGGEVVGWTAAESREFGDTKLGSVGRPHHGVSIRSIDPVGNDTEPDDPGELVVITPVLESGTVPADVTDRLTTDGWFRTGDIGRVDADGFVWIEGRVSDMINRGGLKVFPAEVAEVLRLHPAIADAAVVGIPDDRLGEVPIGFLVPVAGHDVPADADLDLLCREHLAPYKVPVRYVTLDGLPRNEIGKVLAKDLVAIATDAHAG